MSGHTTSTTTTTTMEQSSSTKSAPPNKLELKNIKFVRLPIGPSSAENDEEDHHHPPSFVYWPCLVFDKFGVMIEILGDRQMMSEYDADEACAYNFEHEWAKDQGLARSTKTVDDDEVVVFLLQRNNIPRSADHRAPYKEEYYASASSWYNKPFVYVSNTEKSRLLLDWDKSTSIVIPHYESYPNQLAKYYSACKETSNTVVVPMIREILTTRKLSKELLSTTVPPPPPSQQPIETASTEAKHESTATTTTTTKTPERRQDDATEVSRPHPVTEVRAPIIGGTASEEATPAVLQASTTTTTTTPLLQPAQHLSTRTTTTAAPPSSVTTSGGLTREQEVHGTAGSSNSKIESTTAVVASRSMGSDSDSANQLPGLPSTTQGAKARSVKQQREHQGLSTPTSITSEEVGAMETEECTATMTAPPSTSTTNSHTSTGPTSDESVSKGAIAAAAAATTKTTATTTTTNPNSPAATLGYHGGTTTGSSSCATVVSYDDGSNVNTPLLLSTTIVAALESQNQDTGGGEESMGTSSTATPITKRVSLSKTKGSRSNKKRSAPAPPASSTRRDNNSNSSSTGSSSSRKKSKIATSSNSNSDMVPLSIPTFAKVRPILQKAGFVLGDKHFGRPALSDEDDSEVRSFDTINELRKDLCSYGLDDHENWTDLQRELVHTWIVTSIIDVERNAALLKQVKEYPVYEKGDLDRYLGELFPPELGVYTLLDDCNATERKFLTVKELRDHLARFGLPKTCQSDDMDPTKRLYIELNLTYHNLIFVVKPRTDEGTPGQGGRPNRRRESLGSTVKPRRQSSDRAEPNSTSRKTPIRTATPHSSFSGRDYQSPMATNRIVEGASGISVSPLVRRISILSDRPTYPTPLADQGQSCRDKLMACRNRDLSKSTICYLDGSHYHRNLQKVEMFVRSVIESEAAHGVSPNDPASLYICGGPGTGKTAGVRWCCDTLIHEYSSALDEDDRKPVVCHIRGSNLLNSFDPQHLVFQRMVEALGLKSDAVLSLKNIKTQMSRLKAFLILVVDELDMLLSDDRKANNENLSTHEDALREMANWAKKESVPVALIGIANRRGNDQYQRLTALVQFQETVDFRAYSKEEILHILESIIGTSTFAKPALAFVATKASQNRGDLRYALGKIDEAVTLCFNTLPESELNGIPTKPPVTMKHVHKVFQAENQVRDTMEGLPRLGKALLVVLATLTQEKIHSTTIGMLKDFVMESLGSIEDDVMSTEDFICMLSVLNDKGLIEYKNQSTGSDSFLQEIQLGKCLEEVLNLVNEELCKTRIYAELRDSAIARQDKFRTKTHHNGQK